MPNYDIRIHRGSLQGDLSFKKDGKEVFITKCSWDPKDKINAGVYIWCTATRMSRKKDSKFTLKNRPGIWIPRVPQYQEIFIHEGKLQNYDTVDKWSDGCIILERKDMMRIWNSITPKNFRNVIVEITDEASLKDFYLKNI